MAFVDPTLNLMRKRVSLLAICLLLVAVVGVLLFYNPQSSFPPVPKPNGYEALTRAASKLQRPSETTKEITTEKLAEAMAGNSQVLEEVRRALELPGVVSVQMSESWFKVHTAELMNLKAAAVVLDSDAELRSRRRDTNGALVSALNGLRLSEATQRGGVLIDHLVGSACEAIALRRMTNLMAGLDAAHCKQALLGLQEYDERRDSLEAIQKREKEWSRRSFGILQRIGALIRPMPNLTPNLSRDYNTRVREVRLVLLRIAARANTLERGITPTNAVDLVPAYLQRVPLDPETGKPLDLR